MAIVALLGLLGACGAKGSDTDVEEGAAVDEGPLQYAPIVGYDRFNWENAPVVMYVPPDPVGMVWLFHGTSGSVAFASKLETVVTTNELILEGIGFIATQSIDQGFENRWNDDTTDVDANEDLQRLFSLREHVIETTDVTEETATFALGFSNGGNMSGIFAQAGLDHGWNVRATGPHLSGGSVSGLDKPVIWIIGVNDEKNNEQKALDEMDIRDADKLTSEIHYCPEQLITPDYFTKNPAIDLARSENTQAEMVRLELIDEAGERLAPDDELESYLHLFEQEAKITSATLRTEEIRVAWSMHRMNGMFAREVRDFFVDAL
jgi:hypothetical protein